MTYPEKIKFNEPPSGTKSLAYMQEAIERRHISGDGYFTQLCHDWLEKLTGSVKCLLTTSCTHALEMSALLCDIQPGDEVIMPSFTFVSTANAFVLRGAHIVFVDIRPDTMNIDEKLIEGAVTERTKAIVPVHYAGVGCEMAEIKAIAARQGLLVVEDAAQGIMSTYVNQPLGGIGDIGCLSFHETKNFSMGEGGAILLNKEEYVKEAEIIREKGTDRARFFRGQTDKYTWQSAGSSYLPSELNAAYLYGQLEEAARIQEERVALWKLYNEHLTPLCKLGDIELPTVPASCVHNAHMFYIKCHDLNERSALIKHLSAAGILAVFHYIPLHQAPAAARYAHFHGEDRHTTKESERLLRLPLFQGLGLEQVEYICEQIERFYRKEKHT
ncbi:MAG: dTDP-4-amino-4,6-dideoxygalactose transaminase [Lachnospiraceae bacterium]|jgi:dTDP-4-amino-4,6-dideoxygalactose transaminase|nr:dTDP-4-amino-4,6-dideoxygalactose transaminase [Lachnospiraceae bacterium]